MKKFLFMLCMATVIFICNVYAESTVSVEVSPSTVSLTINGMKINNEFCSVLIYKDIIYVPAFAENYTFFSEILNTYVAAENIIAIDNTKSSSLEIMQISEHKEKCLIDEEKQFFKWPYDDSQEPMYFWEDSFLSLKRYYTTGGISHSINILDDIEEFQNDIYVCGEKYTDSKYPFLVSHSLSGDSTVIFMPLTYELGKNLGWKINYTQEKGMMICTNTYTIYCLNPNRMVQSSAKYHLFTCGTTTIGIKVYSPYNYKNPPYNQLYISVNGEPFCEKSVTLNGEPSPWLLGCENYYYNDTSFAYVEDMNIYISYLERKITINGVKLVENGKTNTEVLADIVIDIDTGEILEENVR